MTAEIPRRRRYSVPIANLGDLFPTFFQPARMPAAMEDRENPNLFLLDDLVNAVKLEPMHWRPAHVCKSYTMKRR